MLKEEAESIAESIRRYVSSGEAGAVLGALAGEFFEGQFEASLGAVVYEQLAEAAIKQGENFLGYDLALAGEKRAAEVGLPDFRLRQLEALALARSGAPHRAGQCLEELEALGANDPRTVGLLARTYRDFALAASDPGGRHDYFLMAFEKAHAGFQQNRGYYNGVQAAQFALLGGDREGAMKLAGEVKELCRVARAEGSPRDDPFWVEETTAECLLIEGQVEEARKCYRGALALALGTDRVADVGAALKVCRLILGAIGERPDLFDGEFQDLIPPVGVFSGHLFDAPGRGEPRFPMAMEAAAADRLDEFLEELQPQGGFCAGAIGSDLLFAEAMIRRGGDVTLVLPYDVERGRIVVGKFGGEGWIERYEAVVGSARSVKELDLQSTSPSPIDFSYTNQVMNGLALLKARTVESRVIPLALWNGEPGDDAGGTAEFVGFWRNREVEPLIVPTAELTRNH